MKSMEDNIFGKINSRFTEIAEKEDQQNELYFFIIWIINTYFFNSKQSLMKRVITTQKMANLQKIVC